MGRLDTKQSDKVLEVYTRILLHLVVKQDTQMRYGILGMKVKPQLILLKSNPW